MEKTICGLDEAGRGALAGPLVIAAVVFPESFNFIDAAPDIVIRDSKKLSKKQRNFAFEMITKYCLLIETEILTSVF